ncbi:NAD(P)H-dependent oxidoreductase [Hydrogenophaga sp. 2FB]|uniref:NADPH-dependent FMN reductase n=1 Tax=Hydrogenophaga sp. 2FB TaxID=2502187 RepID=UPI0010FA1D5F|nr:NAD(P)H-dependent oxidoreductase [Hydrogenophaga sp. 2FB]
MTSKPLPLLIFAGSTRAQSHNRRLAHIAADMARNAGAQVTHIELADYELPIYNADLEARGTPAAAIRLKEIFHAHPAWVICSPEYNGSYTGLLKNTIDWVSSPVKSDPEWTNGIKPFEGKVVGLLSASPGALGGLRSLSHLSPMLLNLQCWLTPKQFALSRANEAFDPEGQLFAESARLGVRGVVEQAIWAGQRLSA